MDLDELTALCLRHPGAVVEHPFGPTTRVIKVAGRIFALIAEDSEPLTISLKCDPELVPLLRRSYSAVRPGYHLNKRHWNTITLDGSVTEAEVAGWIEDSYDLVVAGLPRSRRPSAAG